MADQKKPVEDQLADVQQTNKSLTQRVEELEKDLDDAGLKIVQLQKQLERTKALSRLRGEQLQVRCSQIQTLMRMGILWVNTEIAGLPLVGEDQVDRAYEEREQTHAKQLGPQAAA